MDLSEPLSNRALEACSKPRCHDWVLELLADNAYLRKQLCIERGKNAELQISILSKDNAKAILDQQSPKSVYDHLERNEQELEIWKSKTHDKAALGSFIKNVNKQQNTKDLEILQEHMDRIHFKLEDMLQGLCGRSVKPQQLLVVAQPKLQKLCRRVFGFQVNHDKAISCNYLIRSLASAAVCEWVFENELRETCTTSSLLLEIMLSQVTMLGKWL